MAVNLPDLGESPWGEELNAAITGLDNDLQATKTRLTGDETSFDARLDALEAVSQVTGVTVTPNAWVGAPNDTHSLVATVVPAWASNRTVVWATLDPAIATVDSIGTVTAKAIGTTNVTATSTSGPVGACVVTVSATVPVTGLSVNPPTVTLSPAGTVQLVPTVAPSNATDKTVTYVSDNLAVATVDTAGLVTAVGPGAATITATSTSGSFADTTAINVDAAGL